MGKCCRDLDVMGSREESMLVAGIEQNKTEENRGKIFSLTAIILCQILAKSRRLPEVESRRGEEDLRSGRKTKKESKGSAEKGDGGDQESREGQEKVKEQKMKQKGERSIRKKCCRRCELEFPKMD